MKIMQNSFFLFGSETNMILALEIPEKFRLFCALTWMSGCITISMSF